MMSVKLSLSLLVRIWKIRHPSPGCGFVWMDFTRGYLTNRFHVAVRLFRSQMRSKFGKNKKVAHDAKADCSYHVLTSSVIYN